MGASDIIRNFKERWFLQENLDYKIILNDDEIQKNGLRYREKVGICLRLVR